MTAFVYHEGEGGKGANDVCSMLKYYIDNLIPEEVENLYIFGDNCAGQNKNNTLIRFIMALTESKRFKSVTLYFPQRGHSFMPNDRDFGLIKKKLNKTERYYTVNDVTDVIKTASKIENKFTIIEMNNENFLQFTTWWPQYYKKNCLSVDSYGRDVPRGQKRPFQISTYSEMSVESKASHRLRCSTHINGLTNDIFCLRNNTNPMIFPTHKAYAEKKPINIKKMDDLKKTMCYIPEEKMEFWSEILLWPTSTGTDEDME